MGMNHFGDLTDEEFSNLLGMKNRPKPVRTGEDKYQVWDPVPDPDFDWSKLGNGKGVHVV